MTPKDAKEYIGERVHWADPNCYGTGNYIFGALKIRKKQGKFHYAAELYSVNDPDGRRGYTAVRLEEIEPAKAEEEKIEY